MEQKPNILSYEYKMKAIDSHTMGEPTRIIYDGFPELPGKTMMEKKNYLVEHYDFLRTAIMLEPRGHRDMFGALLTDPVHEEADFGVIFMDSGSYLNMCGHGSIGTASMLVETGMVEVKEPYTEVVLDAPSGIIRTRVHVVNGKAVEVSILNVPSFLYEKDLQLELPGYGLIPFDISFGGSFFALIDAEKINLNIEIENIKTITDIGMSLLKKINQEIKVKHPYLDITTVDLAEFYCHTDNEKADMKNCVIFGDAQADRSPCGTGTSAKMAALYAKKELGLRKEFVYESITGSLFKGMVMREVEIDGKIGIIPQITGSAYITGKNEWIIDGDDPLKYGFLLGTITEESTGVRSRIVQAAWNLFQEKGFEETTIPMIIEAAGVTMKEFEREFQEKEDLEDTLGELFDQKYEQLMIAMNPQLSYYERLLYLNQELFKLIEESVPFTLVKHVYVSLAEERHNLLNRNRFYYKLIPQIIQEGQEKGEFHLSDSVENVADNYASLERGMIYDWCVMNGKYSLCQKSHQLLPIFLKQMLA